jgi:hypothetical protein
MTRYSVPGLILFLCLSTGAWAVNYTNAVLQIGVGARALGMGGAYVAVADDSTATYWNPAGLPSIQHMEVSADEQGRENAALSDGTNEVGSDYIFMSGGMTIPDIGTVGVAAMRYGVSGISQIPNVQTCATCPPPAAIGTFGTNDVAILAGFGRQIFPALNLGLTVKYLYGGTSGLQADSSNGITGDVSYMYGGADLGALLKFGQMTSALEGLNFGINAQDLLSSGVKWTSDPTVEPVSVNAKSGLAYSPPFAFLTENHTKLTLAADMDPEYSTLLHYGAEIWFKDTVAFRAGMRHFTNGMQSDEDSIGASFRIYVVEVDYAYINYELTPVQYLSMLVSF